jgi:AraC-like DNA-binding protein
MAVESVFEKHGLRPSAISLGEVLLEEEEMSREQYQSLQQSLHDIGFELLEDKRKVMVAQIKAAIVDLVHHNREALKINLSSYLSDKLNIDYANLSNVFSSEEKSTIEHYYIQQKIERVKELLSYGELTLSEIAFELNYSSVAHLSAQFKKETGLTPSQFRQDQQRRSLDSV